MDRQYNVKSLLLLMVSIMVALLLSGCGGSGGSEEESSSSSSTTPATSSTQPDNTSVQLQRLTLTAFPIKTKGTSELTLITGNEQSFLAVGEYSNGQSRVLTEELSLNDWQSSDTELGEFIQSGVLKGKSPGEITVFFSQDNLTSNPVKMNIIDAELANIVVTPAAVRIAKGHNQTLTATATYTNGLSANISDSVTWIPVDDNDTVIISPDGQITGEAVGTTTLTALKDGVVSNTVDIEVTNATITRIIVNPSVINIAKGQSQAMTATAIYSDDTTSDISNSVNWVPANPSIVTPTTNRLLLGVQSGTTTLTAVKDDVTSQTVGVVVSDAVITQINVEPSIVNIAKGQQQTLKAIATYSDDTSSDISDSVTWKPVDRNTATVTSSGILFGSNVGTTTLTALKDTVLSNAVGVEVSDAVVTDINLSPSTVSLAKGQTETITAMATYSDGTESNISDSVTWTSMDMTTATVASGLLTGADLGMTTISASIDSVTSNTIDVEITNAVMTGLTLNPPAVGLMVNASQPMKATAVYSDGSSSDVSDKVIWWSPSNTNEMSITADGLVTGVSEGSSHLSATYDGFTTSVEVNVCSSDGDGSNITGKCLYALDYGDGYLLTNTPSIAYLDSLGIGGDEYTSGTDGLFYTFEHAKATALCSKYNDFNLFGRSNWRLPTLNEIMGVYNHFSPILTWENSRKYIWTSTSSESLWTRYRFQYVHGWLPVSGTYYWYFASCRSVPN